MTPEPSKPAGSSGNLLRHFPADVQDAYQRLRANGDPAAADTLVIAVMLDHLPDKKKRPATTPDDSLSLIGDLGFDSVAIAEMVFFFEDLLEVSISNAEILQVRTVGDLRRFVREKLAAQSTGSSPAPA